MNCIPVTPHTFAFDNPQVQDQSLAVLLPLLKREKSTSRASFLKQENFITTNIKVSKKYSPFASD